MAIRYADGFDHWGAGTSTTIPTGFTLGGWVAGGSNTNIYALRPVASNARTGSYSCRCPGINSFNNGFSSRTLSSPHATIGVGFAMYNTVAHSNGNYTGVSIYQVGVGYLCRISFLADGVIAVYNNDYSVQLGASVPGTLTLGSYNWIEIKAVIGPVGSIEVRVNEGTVVQVNGHNFGAGTGADRVYFGTTNSGTTTNDWYIDDLVIWDGSGTSNNDWVGDIRCRTVFAISDTVEADWTPSTGVNGYAMIDEVPPNGATDYIQAAIAGDVSEFNMTQLPDTVSEVIATQCFAYLAKDDAGSCSISVGVNSAGTAEMSSPFNVGTGYTYYQDTIENNPATGVPFTKAEFNSSLMRIERLT